MEGQWGDIIDIVNEPQLEQAEVAYNLPNINLQFNETNRINQVKTSGNSSSCTILTERPAKPQTLSKGHIMDFGEIWLV